MSVFAYKTAPKAYVLKAGCLACGAVGGALIMTALTPSVDWSIDECILNGRWSLTGFAKTTSAFACKGLGLAFGYLPTLHLLLPSPPALPFPLLLLLSLFLPRPLAGLK